MHFQRLSPEREPDLGLKAQMRSRIFNGAISAVPCPPAYCSSVDSLDQCRNRV